MDISIIVCTFNRCHHLIALLNSLERSICQHDLAWEILVVDNNSSDNTRYLINNFIANTSINVRYLFEAKQGKPNALNAGIAAATGNILAFTDDDCIVDGNWISCIFNVFNSNSNISGVGGRVELYDVRDKPITIMTSMDKSELSSFNQIFSFIHGCNMAFSKKVFNSVGTFDEIFFSPDTKICSTEDIDFIYRVFKGGFKIVYNPDILLFHNHGRRTDQEVFNLMKGYLIGRGAFYCKHILKTDKDIFKMAYWEISSFIGKVLDIHQGKGTRKKYLEYLQALITGAYYYILASCKKALKKH